MLLQKRAMSFLILGEQELRLGHQVLKEGCMSLMSPSICSIVVSFLFLERNSHMVSGSLALLWTSVKSIRCQFCWSELLDMLSVRRRRIESRPSLGYSLRILIHCSSKLEVEGSEFLIAHCMSRTIRKKHSKSV